MNLAMTTLSLYLAYNVCYPIDDRLLYFRVLFLLYFLLFCQLLPISLSTYTVCRAMS